MPMSVALRSRALRVGLLGLVLGYGALLRFDALTLTYGVVEHPAWLKAAQQARLSNDLLRPDSFGWARWQGRYISDPYTYLQYARSMTAFYAAHRREPLFPFATKVSLKLLGGQDIAVSFASMFFSVLAVGLTFVLGRYAFSYWVGIAAALAMAIEYDLVTWGVGGWRDDAFTCAVVLSAYAMLRLARTSSFGDAAFLGVIAGLACLVRITAVSFLVPGFAWLLFARSGPSQDRTILAAVAVMTGALVAGPYIVNCWRTFGDPLYAINVHADVYRAAEGQAPEGYTAASYVSQGLRNRPWQTVDTVLLGMTTYPFTNKWIGFDRWASWIGTILSWAAFAGLLLFVLTPTGRLLLIVLAGSLLPYAMTWRLIYDWRFTEHAYPFFLIAAFFAFQQLVDVSVFLARRQRGVRLDLRPVRAVALLVMTVALIAWVSTRFLPVRIAAESLRAGDAVVFGGGNRDDVFFGKGWSAPVQEGNVIARISQTPFPEMWVPLDARQAYELTIRMDPYPAPSGDAGLPSVRVFLNERPVASLELGWNPERVGAYSFDVPAGVAKSGLNRLKFAATRAGADARIRVWWVRVRRAATP
jgi:hypothetical protein